MTTLVLYVAIAFLIVILATVLARPGESAETEPERDYILDLSDERGSRLAERIFDPSDFFWLRDDVRYPELAAALARARQQLALRWLKALRRSVEELARIPEPTAASAADRPAASWQLLWLTLRFHLLLSYALLVVRLFGPYHRLVPSLLPSFARPRPIPGRAGYGTTGTGVS